MNFENRTGGSTYWTSTAAMDTGRDLALQLQDELMRGTTFQAIERDRLEGLMHTAGPRSAEGRLTRDLEAKIGQELGARYLIYGTVTRYEAEKEVAETEVLDTVASASQLEGHVQMRLTVVDARSGNVVTTITADGEEDAGEKVEVRDEDDPVDVAADQRNASKALAAATREALQSAAKQLSEALGTS